MVLVPRVIAALRDRGVDDVLLVLGGIIPADEIEPLRDIGIAGVFGPGTPMREIVEFIRQHAPARGA
jgi:methylmalonyl-CoA mutase C-terminal domain/subunit